MKVVKIKFQATKNNVKENKEEYDRPYQSVGERAAEISLGFYIACFKKKMVEFVYILVSFSYNLQSACAVCISVLQLACVASGIRERASGGQAAILPRGRIRERQSRE